MDDEIKRFIQESVQSGIQRAFGNYAMDNREISDAPQEGCDSSNNEESQEEGIELPSEILEWFQGNQEKLSKEAYKRILEQNPEPRGGLLEPPRLDRFLRALVPQETLKKDEVLAAIQADTTRNIRPIIAIATSTSTNSEILRKCRQAVTLALNTAAKITIQRRVSVLRSLNMDETEIKYWCREVLTSRDVLFGEEFQMELEAYQQRHFHDSISRIVDDRAHSFAQSNPTPFDSTQRKYRSTRRGGWHKRSNQQ